MSLQSWMGALSLSSKLDPRGRPAPSNPAASQRRWPLQTDFPGGLPSEADHGAGPSPRGRKATAGGAGRAGSTGGVPRTSSELTWRPAQTPRLSRAAHVGQSRRARRRAHTSWPPPEHRSRDAGAPLLHTSQGERPFSPGRKDVTVVGRRSVCRKREGHTAPAFNRFLLLGRHLHPWPFQQAFAAVLRRTFTGQMSISSPHYERK